MDKMIYITDIDKLIEKGVYKKIISQGKAFSKYYEVKILYKENNSLCIHDLSNNIVDIFENFFSASKIEKQKLYKIRRFMDLNKLNTYIYKYIKENNIKILYIRKYFLLNKGLNYMKYAKSKLGCNIIYEMPTYPYTGEILYRKKYLSYLINWYLEYKIEKIVDFITVILGEDIEFKSKKYISIMNGIDASRIKAKNKLKLQTQDINLIGVSHIDFWNGYDRVIKGLNIYYHNKENINSVYFHIVGEGSELSNLIKLVDQYGINDYVIFHGSMTGGMLDQLFDKCDIAIGSLAIHRSGLKKSSSLKNRDYCARGIPFIIASEDGAFKDFKYILQIDRDDTPVNINKIIEFYNANKNENYIEEMRTYAKQNLSWEAVMEPIINKIINKI